MELNATKRRKKRYKQWALNDFNDIMKRYDITIPYNIVDYAADVVAHYKAEAKKASGSGFKGLINNPMQWSLYYIGKATNANGGGAIIGFQANSEGKVEGYVNAAIAGSAILHASADLATGYEDYRAKLLESPKISVTQENQPNSKSEIQLLFSGYARYANGNIYNQGNPGSQRYNITKPFNICLAAKNEANISKQIQNRSQIKLAGNINYLANLLQSNNVFANLPNTDELAIARQLEHKLGNITAHINKAFKELANANFHWWPEGYKEAFIYVMKDKCSGILSSIDGCVLNYLVRNYNKGLRCKVPNLTKAIFYRNLGQDYKAVEENDESLQRQIEAIIADPNVSEKEKQMLYSSYLHEILANFVSITKVSEFGTKMLDAETEFSGWKELKQYFYKDPYEDEYTDQEVVSILTHLRSIESNYSSGRSIYITGASRMAQVDRKRLSGEELFAYDKVVNLQIWSGFIPDYQE